LFISNDFLITYGGALILPLSVIEGPFVALLSGFLSAQGYIAWYVATGLLLAGDLIGDVLYYWLGRSGAAPLARVAGWLGVRREISPQTQQGLTENAVRMWLIGKWTHSIGFIVLIGSGMLRLPLARFMLVNLLAGVPKVALLFGIGYFAGDHLPRLERHLVLITTTLCAVGIAAAVLVLRRAGRIRADEPSR
jgi:membrane protein DedA with SNARE-associated domain